MNKVYFSPASQISGTNIWKVEGKRYICITFEYNPVSGELKYASCVWRNPSFRNNDESEQMVKDHEKTTERRFRLRPVEITVHSGLGYDAIITEIRHQMCHGPGCKGPRNSTYAESQSDESETSSYVSVEDDEHQVSSETYKLKTTHLTRYYLTGNKETRHIFIAFKGRQKNGDLLYGAAIMHTSDPDYMTTPDQAEAHFKTAIERLNKCPVPMKISKEHRHQLAIKPKCRHREDVTIEIVDEIFKRQGGQLKVRGLRSSIMN